MTKYFFSLLFCLAAGFSQATPMVITATSSVAVESVSELAINFDEFTLTVDDDECTMTGEFTTSGGSSYSVTVTAPTCGEAATIMQGVAEMIDEL